MKDNLENIYDGDFEKYNAPKWLDRYCLIVNGGICIFLFLRTILYGTGITKLISDFSISFDSIFELFAHLVVIGVLFVGFVISLVISMVGNHYFDWCFKGQKKILTMLSSFITVPGAVFLVILVVSIFSGCAESGLWGILDPRFL